MNLPEINARIVEHLPWVHVVARHIAHQAPPWFTPDDVIGSAELALVEVARHYDPKRGEFKSFSRPRIQGACWDAVRRHEYRERAHLPLLACAETLEQPPVEFDIPLWQHLEALPKEAAQVIRLLYLNELTNGEIAKRLKLTPAMVCYHHKQGLRLLKQRLAHTRQRKMACRKRGEL